MKTMYTPRFNYQTDKLTVHRHCSMFNIYSLQFDCDQQQSAAASGAIFDNAGSPTEGHQAHIKLVSFFLEAFLLEQVEVKKENQVGGTD